MAKFSEHQSSKYVKVLYAGDSGTGKTGSLVSLVKAGYKIGIIDMDDGLDALRNHVLDECPELIDNVEYETFGDDFIVTPVGEVMLKGSPRAFSRCSRLLARWAPWGDGKKPRNWGEDKIIVVDSVTALGRGGLWVSKYSNPDAADRRSHYFRAQDALEDLTSVIKHFKTNVVLITHIDYREERNKKGEVIAKDSFVTTVGSKLGPKYPKYFNTLLQAKVQRRGRGKVPKRTILTLPSEELDLKTPNPMKIKPVYPLSTGMADIFATLKGNTDEHIK